MPILPIRIFPDRILKNQNHDVSEITPQVRRLIGDLIDTMRHHPRCVGLAAPQVGHNVRLAVVDTSAHPKSVSSSGLLVLINPEITERQDMRVAREGCLSVPDFTGNVARADRIKLAALDASGAAWSAEFCGFEAIAIQHEVDHLDGKLFLDRVQNIRTDVFKRKQYWFPESKS